MGKQLMFEDVQVGDEVPTLVKHPTTRQLVKWAGASGDWFEIHYDKDVALKNGLPGVIVHGWLPFCAYGQMLRDWVGLEGDIKAMNCTYRGMLLPGYDHSYKGKVTKKYEGSGENLVDCELYCEDQEGKVANQAAVTVCLPSKA